jgi:hypothetical protein
MALGGGEVKNQRGKIWDVTSDHNTTRILKVPERRIFRKKNKLAGEDPLDPLALLTA